MKLRYKDPEALEKLRERSRLKWNDPEYRKSRTAPPGQTGFNELYKRYKSTAIFRKLAFEIDKETFRTLTSGVCHYCGGAPKQCSRRHRGMGGQYFYNGIDRLDNSKGYIDGNIVSCCEHCNKAKRMMSEEEFKNWVLRVYYHYVLDVVKGQ